MRIRTFLAALACGLVTWAGPATARMTASATPRSDRLEHMATLTATASGGHLGFDSVAISGPTIVANSYVLDSHQDAGIYVFSQPAAGWSNAAPVAHLTAPAVAYLTTVAVSADTVVAAAPDTVYVYAKPPGGWSGTLAPSARLVASDAQAGSDFGFRVSASGDTVTATGGDAVYVFTKPAHGWSGTVEQSAKLLLPGGADAHSALIDGRTVFAGTVSGYPSPNSYRGAVYVFEEPAHGWRGTISPLATLAPSTHAPLEGDLAVAGDTVAASAFPPNDGGTLQIYLFTRPRHGWEGIRHEQAIRTLPADSYTLGPFLGGAAQTFAAVKLEPGPNHMCPCGSSIYAFSEPSGGWSGRYPTVSSASLATASPPAVSGQTVAVGDEGGVHVFRAIAPPSLGRIAVSGLGAGRPRIDFTVAAGADTPAIRSVRIVLPRGLTFGPGTPTRTLVPARHRLSVTLTSPALAMTAALRRRVEHRRRTLTLRVSVTVTDAAGTRTVLPLTIRLSA